jgi:hypothetical protein
MDWGWVHDETLHIISVVVREVRRKANQNQQEFGARYDLSAWQVSMLENGHRGTHLDRFHAILADADDEVWLEYQRLTRRLRQPNGVRATLPTFASVS